MSRFIKIQKTSLYERLGEEAIDMAVDYLYREALADNHISRFFEDVDLDRLRYKQKMFLTMALGGPNKYTGRDLRRAHSPLLKWGLDNTHFDRVLEILRDALRHIPAHLGRRRLFYLCAARR